MGYPTKDDDYIREALDIGALEWEYPNFEQSDWIDPDDILMDNVDNLGVF